MSSKQYWYDADSNMLYQDNMVSAMGGRSELFTCDGLNRLTNLSIRTMTVSGGVARISSRTRQQG